MSTFIYDSRRLINFSENKKEKEAYSYAKTKDGYFSAPLTVKKIPEAVYQMEEVPNLGWGLKPIQIAADDYIPLNDGFVEDLVKDIDVFWNSEKKYDSLKFVHKRGILLYGQPGCGKTHIINKLSEVIIGKKGVVLMANEHPSYIVKGIRLVKDVEPNKKIMVVFEDIDSLFKKYEEALYLQMLDGGLSVSNIVFIATTNHPEVLHDRVTNRPSRFDISLEIKKPNEAIRRNFITAKFKEIKYNGDIELFVHKTKDMSIAHIKELIISACIMGYNFNSALKKLNSMKIKPRISKDDSIGFSQNGNGVELVLT